MGARVTVLGTVVAPRTRDREPFDEQDNVLIDELVGRAALNTDNARLYTSQRQAALTLQNSLMSTSLPKPPGFELACRYLPAGIVNEVGGGWFDVISLPGGATALIMGDVMGHGIHAAAAMGRLRTVVRTLAPRDTSPARLLRSLDATVADLGENEMATCVYAVYDPAAGSCRIARAGHPPPALVHADGTVEFLDGPSALPSVSAGRSSSPTRCRCRGTARWCCTPTDSSRPATVTSTTHGLSELTDALRVLSGPLEEVCDGILDGLLPPQAQDDVALLLAGPV